MNPLRHFSIQLHLLLCILLLASCTEKKKAIPLTKTYALTYAFVLIPDSLMAQYNGTFKDNTFHFSPEDRHRLATHLLAHLDQYPSYQLDGHWRPLVRIGQESIVKFDTKKSPASTAFEAKGYRIQNLEMTMRIDVPEDLNNPQISCWWQCQYSVDDWKTGKGEGGGRPGWPMLVRGKAEMAPMFYKPKDETFWIIVRID